MENKKLKSITTYLGCLCLSFLLASGILLFNNDLPVFATNIPTADVIYDSNNIFNEPLTITQNLTVKFSGVEYSSTGTNSSPIAVRNNSTVNLIFEGENTFNGNPDVISAGIEVENGSTVNIYGLEGSTLTITGGKYSAGIGGIGYNAASTENPSCGNINIYSGNITAIGGDRGAGIGSGYHSSASDINIFGGNITALGTECAAGIGSGYGTSGGAAVNNSGNPTGSGVGFYNGGNINISGGTIRAASYHINFNNFNPYNIETLYSEGYSDSFAAGIGGGYGASSGNIVIEGNADVTALGACGGAGIGSGRGTSKAANYDSDNFNVNVTIKGNAKVIAMATDDKRTNVVGDDGGAAIGLGRGCTLEGELKGSVKIEENANVYAVAPDHAQAIGGSCVVGKFSQTNGVISRPANATLAEINIGKNTTVTAISDGYRNAIENSNGSNLSKLISLNFDESYFANHGDFFTTDKFPLKIEAIDADNTNSKITFALQSPSKMNCMVNVPNANRYNFVIKEHKGTNNESIFLSNPIEENSAQFFTDPNSIKSYDIAGLTAILEQNANIDSTYGTLDFKIKASEGIFEYGSNLNCANINDPSIISELNANMDNKYSESLNNIVYFDLGVNKRSGEAYSNITGGNIKIYVKVPEDWNIDKVLPIFINPNEDETFNDTLQTEKIDGVTYLSFQTNHLGKYALLESKSEQQNNEQEENNSSENQSHENDIKEITKTVKHILETLDKIFSAFWNAILKLNL